MIFILLIIAHSLVGVINLYAEAEERRLEDSSVFSKPRLQKGPIIIREEDPRRRKKPPKPISSGQPKLSPKSKQTTSRQTIALIEVPGESGEEGAGLKYVAPSHSVTSTTFSLSDNVTALSTAEREKISRFFTHDIWNDKSFQNSLQREYEEAVDTKKVKETFKEFKDTYTKSLQKELENYNHIIQTIIEHNLLKNAVYNPVNLKIKKIDKKKMIDGESTSYVLTYDGYKGQLQHISEKSIKLLLGHSFFESFRAKEQRAEGVNIIIPYKEGLDTFLDDHKVFSLRILRKAYCQ